MSQGKAPAIEVQKKTEPARQLEQEVTRQPEQGPVQQVAPQAAYRRAQVSRNGLPADLLALQQAVGNRHVHRMVAPHHTSINPLQQSALTEEKPEIKVQTEFTIGEPNNVHEKIIDHMKELLAQMPAPTSLMRLKDQTSGLLAEEPRSLTTSPDPSSLSKLEIKEEITRIDNWLKYHGEDTEPDLVDHLIKIRSSLTQHLVSVTKKLETSVLSPAIIPNPARLRQLENLLSRIALQTKENLQFQQHLVSLSPQSSEELELQRATIQDLLDKGRRNLIQLFEQRIALLNQEVAELRVRIGPNPVTSASQPNPELEALGNELIHREQECQQHEQQLRSLRIWQMQSQRESVDAEITDINRKLMMLPSDLANLEVQILMARRTELEGQRRELTKTLISLAPALYIVTQGTVSTVSWGETSSIYPTKDNLYRPDLWDQVKTFELLQARSAIDEVAKRGQKVYRAMPSQKDIERKLKPYHFIENFPVVDSKIADTEVKWFYLSSFPDVPQVHPSTQNTEIVKTYGPFHNIGGGDAPKGSIYIHFYKHKSKCSR